MSDYLNNDPNQQRIGHATAAQWLVATCTL